MCLARSSLYAMTLANYNNNAEKLVEEIEAKIKLLSCGGKELSSTFADVFRTFSKTSNDELKSLVHQCLRLYDKGAQHKCNFLLQTFLTKHKQLVAEGN